MHGVSEESIKCSSLCVAPTNPVLLIIIYQRNTSISGAETTNQSAETDRFPGSSASGAGADSLGKPSELITGIIVRI
jgi:hypothetical protein